MELNNYLLMNISILYRCGQKFYDKQLQQYHITGGQLPFLISIYENEGISMQELANSGCFDKGTVTKSISRLEDAGYVYSKSSEQDKRVRLLYTTDQTKDIISDLYLIRREWWDKLTHKINTKECQELAFLLEKLTKEAVQYNTLDNKDDVKLFGLQKLTLLDYPNKLASTVFTGGCNMRCPFCHNKDLVFLNENTFQIPTENILYFLKKRKNVLEGVCITGGEPLLNKSIEYLLRNIKNLGYSIKLDTNGCFPERLKELVDKGLVDYVAMDIKNCLDQYSQTVGIPGFDVSPIIQTASYLMENHVDYEFRTTIVKEFHTYDHLVKIGQWLKGANAYYLQAFVDNEHVIQKGLHAYRKEEMENLRQAVLPYIENTHLRGI